MLGLALFFSF
jgi:hypothetical protein